MKQGFKISVVLYILLPLIAVTGIPWLRMQVLLHLRTASQLWRTIL